MICARRGSPLAIGVGDSAMFRVRCPGLGPLTRRICYLEEDWATVTKDTFQVYDEKDTPVDDIKETFLTGAMIGKETTSILC